MIEQSDSRVAMKHSAIFNTFSTHLQKYVWEALNIDGKKNSEIIAVCIQINSYWRELAELLLADEEYENDNKSLFMANIYDSYVRDIIIAHVPGVAEKLSIHSSDKSVSVAVLSDEGCSVFEIEGKNVFLH